MPTPVEQFIRDIHTQYNVKYALTGERLRSLRFKLAMAEIEGEVKQSDEDLAKDIILADYKKSGANLRTASASPTMANSIRNAGTCPRCGSGMQFARLATASEARYCPNCHVCIHNG